MMSGLSAPSPLTNSQTYIIASQPPASLSSAVMTTTDSTDASAVYPVPQQVTSPPFSNHDIYSRALQLLSDSDRAILQRHYPFE